MAETRRRVWYRTTLVKQGRRGPCPRFYIPSSPFPPFLFFLPWFPPSFPPLSPQCHPALPVCSLPPVGPIISVSRRSFAVWMSSSPSFTTNVSAAHSALTFNNPLKSSSRSASDMIPARQIACRKMKGGTSNELSYGARVDRRPTQTPQ